MSRFRAVFGNAHAVLPIIHVVGRDQALRNADTARAGGADGAFLICHGAVCDNTLLRRHTAWQPQYSLERGLRETIEWFQRFGPTVFDDAYTR